MGAVERSLGLFKGVLSGFLQDIRYGARVLGRSPAFTFFAAAVLALQVTRRTQEIGVRMALGAERRDILRMILSRGMRTFVAGALLGLLGAFAVSRLLDYALYDTRAVDPISFAGVTLLLAMIARAACYFPARRAMRVDPIVALRYE